MKYTLVYYTKILKELKLMKKRGKNIKKFTKIVDQLADGEILPAKYRDHAMSGNFKGFRNCHIEPDWILLYRIENGHLILAITGTHSDLF